MATTMAPAPAEVIPDAIPDEGEDIIAHIVNKADAARAYVTGEAIEALCGKLWVPCRDPEGKTLCTRCLAELDKIMDARKR